MSKDIERCPKDVKKLVNPKTGRCVMESSPIIKKLLQDGYTIIVTPNVNQPDPSPENDDIKIFRVCPTDTNKLVNPLTNRCILQTSPIAKKLMSQGWTIAFNIPSVTPIIIKPKGDIDLDTLKKDMDLDKNGIVSINEYLSSVEITPLEEEQKKGDFLFLRTNTNIAKFLKLMRQNDPVFKKNLCWFDQQYYVYTLPQMPGLPKITTSTVFSNIFSNSYLINYGFNYAQLFNAPITNDSRNARIIDLFSKKHAKSSFFIHPNFVKNIRTCKERYFASALGLSVGAAGDKYYKGGHANVLIFDTILKTVDRYDPHGNHCYDGYCPVFDHAKIDSIIKKEIKKILPEYKFIDLSVACPNLGVQLKAERFDRSGYCVTWSLMFTVLRILNPGKTPETIVDKMLEGSPLEIFSKMLKFAKFYSDILKKSI